MNIEKVRELLHAQPFKQFWIHLADGGRILVQHEDFVALDPTGREMSVFAPNGSHHFVDVMLVTRLESKPANGAARGKGR